MQKNKTVLILIGVIAIILIVIFFEMNSPNAGNSEQANNIPVTSDTSGVSTQQSTPNVDVNLKSKCATDGKAYYQDFYKQFTQVKSVWGDPQFHFDSKLNTCLVYIWWNDTSIPDNTYWTADNKYLNSTQIITNNNIVFDVYSNQAVLQNSTTKTYTSVDGVKDEKDVLSDYPYSQDVPNSDVNTFSNQLKILMNE